MGETGWANEATARQYAEFCRKHSMYAETSADLVGLAGIDGNETVVDLACGTGQTTVAILDQLDEGGMVHSVDASPAMLAEAQGWIDDGRVRWHLAPAESLAELVGASDVDAVVCNSAIWQTDMAATFAAIASVLRPGGRFVCNIGRQFLMMPLTDEELNPKSASLHELMHAVAVLDHGHVPGRARAPRGRPRTFESVSQMLVDAGLDVRNTPEFQYPETVERQRDWLSIPVFTERIFPDLTLDQRRAALDEAFGRVAPEPSTSRWGGFLATKPADSMG